MPSISFQIEIFNRFESLEFEEFPNCAFSGFESHKENSTQKNSMENSTAKSLRNYGVIWSIENQSFGRGISFESISETFSRLPSVVEKFLAKCVLRLPAKRQRIHFY